MRYENSLSYYCSFLNNGSRKHLLDLSIQAMAWHNQNAEVEGAVIESFYLYNDADYFVFVEVRSVEQSGEQRTLCTKLVKTNKASIEIIVLNDAQTRNMYLTAKNLTKYSY